MMNTFLRSNLRLQLFIMFYLFRNPITIIHNHVTQVERYTKDSLYNDENAQISQANFVNQCDNIF